MEKPGRSRLADFVRYLHVTWVLLPLVLMVAGLFANHLAPSFGADAVAMRKALMHWAMIGIVTTAASQFIWKGCPMTFLEDMLRGKEYEGDDRSLISRVVFRRLGIRVSPRSIFASLVILCIVIASLAHSVF